MTALGKTLSPIIFLDLDGPMISKNGHIYARNRSLEYTDENVTPFGSLYPEIHHMTRFSEVSKLILKTFVAHMIQKYSMIPKVVTNSTHNRGFSSVSADSYIRNLFLYNGVGDLLLDEHMIPFMTPYSQRSYSTKHVGNNRASAVMYWLHYHAYRRANHPHIIDDQPYQYRTFVEDALAMDVVQRDELEYYHWDFQHYDPEKRLLVVDHDFHSVVTPIIETMEAIMLGQQRPEVYQYADV